MRPAFALGGVRRGGLLAMAAALLFGASTPAAKAIPADLTPLMLAGLLLSRIGTGADGVAPAAARRRRPVTVRAARTALTFPRR